MALIESVKDYSVLFVGDHIVDEYVYVDPLGKSAKEHLIPVRYVSEESFNGGTIAAANHARSFCGSVGVWTGQKRIRKVRMVDRTHMRKLHEIHYEDEYPALRQDESLVHDVTVLTDFGHGAIDTKAVANYATAPFLAVAAQTNSANIGFNLITKYPHADYIVIDEPEARLAAADRDGHIEDVIHKLAHGRCERFVVTHGKNGAYGYDHGRFIHCPALSGDGIPLDTMGAGDAFFAVTAPMAKTGSMEDLLFIGNAAGALKTKIIGHRKPVTKEALIEFISR